MKYKPLKTYNRLGFGYIQPKLFEQALEMEDAAKKYGKLSNILSLLFKALLVVAMLILIYFMINHSLFDAAVSFVVAGIVAVIVNKICGNLYSLKPFFNIIHKDAQ